MQTFLPHPDFTLTAKSLDRQRLGKQRVETLQIAKVVAGASTGWANHPAVRMWLGHPEALLAYQVAICGQWTLRGYKDTCLDKTYELLLPVLSRRGADFDPPWLGDEALHLSHRSNLVRKAPEHYGLLWPGTPDDLPYKWPC